MKLRLSDFHGRFATVDRQQLKNWKDDRIGNYENRLRAFSHPYKVFAYFASKHKNGVPYMSHISPDSVPSAIAFFQLADTNGDGLISFSEYMTFLVLLGTSEYHWRLSFKLFDTDGNGTVSKDEFTLIMGQMLDNLGVGFMATLHLEILKLEFSQYEVDPLTGTISMKDFGSSVISYAAPKNLGRLERQLETFSAQDAERISFGQFFDFDRMVRSGGGRSYGAG
ncbi:hypothetical protein BDK51DRAFT_51404 [Blyttiomyces helicus]|uniref:EF-hand domain-containing protein n=1 Tax=Blyttiomyces helicus TaxID=388810 RepID=A0A4P9W3Z0_9FUNG|nr:hypothetical protein BDK51DRAFT_51404 [Blyttiomyces helicus]|eukprot:RKO87049.1 hypothetical protein BDK51DRAFT_51404 [Blyttiomyces helicus]